TCRCGYEFCWLCEQDWKKTGYGHTCNKPIGCRCTGRGGKSRRDIIETLHVLFFTLYEAHEKSSGAAKKSLENNRETVREFEVSRREIILTKRVLQWSYCFGYYLVNGTKEKDLFETQQGLLESFADRLHETSEKRVDNYESRRELLDLA
ncbi:hypothetical protein RFI_37576, partial [Reticulomyxa filosa]